MTKKKERKEYKVYCFRLNDENINWLKSENKNYRSWNKFFNELRKRYGNETLQRLPRK